MIGLSSLGVRVLQLPFLWQHVFQVPSALGWRKAPLASFSGGMRGVPFLQCETGVWDLVPRKVIKNEWLSFHPAWKPSWYALMLLFLLGFAWKRDTQGGNLLLAVCLNRVGHSLCSFSPGQCEVGKEEILTVYVHKQFLAMGCKDAEILVWR